MDNKVSLPKILNLYLMEILIGLPKVLSLELKTKDNAVHAGLSVLLEFLNVWPNKKDKLSVSLNNNSLTALEAMEIKDAMEDGHHLLLNMLKTRD